MRKGGKREREILELHWKKRYIRGWEAEENDIVFGKDPFVIDDDTFRSASST